MGAPPASSCRHGRRSWASARFTCDLQWGGGVGSSLCHNFLGAILSVSAMTVSRWPYLFLIAIAVALVGISATVQPVPESKRELELYIRHCRRLTEANCLKCSGLWCRTLWIENYIGKKNFVVPCFYAAMPHVFPNVVG